MTDTIHLNRMQFYGYHGVLPEERRIGQRFTVDLALTCDLYQAGVTDRLEDTVDYASVYERVRNIVEDGAYALIEAVAQNIADTILLDFPAVRRCRVQVTKPDPPIAGHYDSVAVEITREKTFAYIGLGSNKGDRERLLKSALEALDSRQKITVMRCSSIYETDPYGPVRQADFLNMAVQTETLLPPHEFLHQLQAVEADLGRTREVHWGPRTMDLDLLIFGETVNDSERLSLPHPEIARRAFVLKPLAEIAPHLIVPGIGRSVMELWQNFNEGEDVRLWRKNNGEGKFGLFEN